MIPEHPPGAEPEVIEPDAIVPAAMSREDALAEIDRLKAEPGGFDVNAHLEIFAAAYPDQEVEDPAAYAAEVAAETAAEVDALVQQTGRERDEIEMWRLEGEQRRGEARDPAATQRVLEQWYGREWQDKMALAQQLVASEASPAVKDWLRRTGMDSHPPLIAAVVRWAEERRST